MKDLQLFKHSEFGELGVLIIHGREYFPATACAKTLGYSNANDAIIRHCKGVVKHEAWVQTGLKADGSPAMRENSANYITEGDLYRLIIRSKLPEAERFERWVFDEVLPSIRKVGAYATPEAAEKLLNNPDFLIEALNEIKAIRARNAELNATVIEMKPKAGYFDVILSTKDAVSATVIAKDYGKSAIWLNNYLHSLGVQFKRCGIWLPYQKYADDGYVCSQTHSYLGSDSEPRSRVHTYWTQKGRLFIYNLLKSHGHLPLTEQNIEEDDSECTI
jgi:prophage antirepressor-like protein